MVNCECVSSHVDLAADGRPVVRERRTNFHRLPLCVSLPFHRLNPGAGRCSLAQRHVVGRGFLNLCTQYHGVAPMKSGSRHNLVRLPPAKSPNHRLPFCEQSSPRPPLLGCESDHVTTPP